MDEEIYWDEIDFKWELDMLAHSNYPFPQHFPFLYNKGVRAIVSIEERRDVFLLKSKGFDYLEVHWEDMTAPTLDQLDKINQFIDKKIAQTKPVLVHCFAGHRSGTALISYLVYSGAFNTCEKAYNYVRDVKGIRTAADINEQKAVLRTYTDPRRLSDVRRS